MCILPYDPKSGPVKEGDWDEIDDGSEEEFEDEDEKCKEYSLIIGKIQPTNNWNRHDLFCPCDSCKCKSKGM